MPPENESIIHTVQTKNTLTNEQWDAPNRNIIIIMNKREYKWWLKSFSCHTMQYIRWMEMVWIFLQNVITMITIEFSGEDSEIPIACER